MPRIESVQLTDENLADGNWAAVLKGSDLEAIEKTGWDAQRGVAVDALPTAEGTRQSLKVAVPWPSPTPRAALYVWLRGESQGRATRAK